jgi:uncharacterized protein with HEPN domain
MNARAGTIEGRGRGNPFEDDACRYRDILACISLIQQFTAGMDFEAYLNDGKTRSAVEQQILIFSEAAQHPGSDAETQCSRQGWRGFRGMGDVLPHACHRVEDRLVWDSVTQERPPLKECIEKVLASGS